MNQAHKDLAHEMETQKWITNRSFRRELEHRPMVHRNRIAERVWTVHFRAEKVNLQEPEIKTNQKAPAQQ